MNRGLLFALEGSKLDTASADLLESRLQTDPNDVDARLKLLGYLFPRSRSSSELARRRAMHIVWFIENEPQHEIVGSPVTSLSDREEPGLADAKAAWAPHLAKPNPDPTILFRAARFFALASPTESQKLLERGEQLRPDWSRWAHELGTLTFRVCRREPSVALAHFERALKLCKDDDERFSSLSDAVRAALEANENQKACTFADEILRLAPTQTANRHRLDYIHTAHIALGRVALAEGDVARAIGELLAAGKVGSADAPVLRSFGPDFSLVSRLYDRGEIASVLAYLDECARFWNPKRVELWRGQIERGEKPRLHCGYDPDLPS